MGVRFYEKDGWDWNDIHYFASGRIIYFKDEEPYFICDRIDTDELIKLFSLEPVYTFESDAKFGLRQNIETRNI